MARVFNKDYYRFSCKQIDYVLELWKPTRCDTIGLGNDEGSEDNCKIS